MNLKYGNRPMCVAPLTAGISKSVHSPEEGLKISQKELHTRDPIYDYNHIFVHRDNK